MKFMNLHDMLIIFMAAYFAVWIFNHFLSSVGMEAYKA